MVDVDLPFLTSAFRVPRAFLARGWENSQNPLMSHDGRGWDVAAATEQSSDPSSLTFSLPA
jgi:hypothetical protein